MSANHLHKGECRHHDSPQSSIHPQYRGRASCSRLHDSVRCDIVYLIIIIIIIIIITDLYSVFRSEDTEALNVQLNTTRAKQKKLENETKNKSRSMISPVTLLNSTLLIIIVRSRLLVVCDC